MTCSLVTISVHYGTGRHLAALDPYEMMMAAKFNWIAQPFHVICTGVGKMSIAVLLLRITPKNTTLRRFLFVLILLVMVTNIVSVAFIFAQCHPTHKLWDPMIKGSCWHFNVQEDMAYLQSAVSSFSDLVLAVLPAPIIWKLQLRLTVKIGLGSAMSLGILSAAAGTAKTIQIRTLSARSDYTYKTVDLILWGCTENFTIITAACIPTLRPLLPMISKRLSNNDQTKRHLNPRSPIAKSHYGGDQDDTYHLRPLPPATGYSGAEFVHDGVHEESMNAVLVKYLPKGVDAQRLTPAGTRHGDRTILKTTEVNVAIC